MQEDNFESLDDVFDYYGRENLIAIDNLKQIIFYTSMGVQPKYIFENQVKSGKITTWFLKNETSLIYRKWQDNNPCKKGK